VRILHLSLSADTGGQGNAIREAFATVRPDWRIDQMRRKPTWIGYPAQYDYAPGLARRLYRAADVVHLNQSLKGRTLFDPAGRIPVVVHHHGTEYRRSQEAIDESCRDAGAVQVAATLDLIGSPGVEWLPSVVDLDRLAGIRAGYRPGPTVRIMHSPTNRAIKSTDVVIATVERLRAQGLPVRLVLVERKPWGECINIKATADIVVDQLELGYGLNAIEAWAMGVPVIAGTTNPTTRARMLETFGTLPFLEAAETNLGDAIEALVRDAQLRHVFGDTGRHHAERFHSPEAVVPRLEAVYHRAATSRAQRPRRRIPAQRGESTMSGYDQDAFWLDRGRRYEAEFRHGPAYAAQEAVLAGVFDAVVPKPTTVLEVAPGFGRIAEVIVKAFPRATYLGVELSPDLAASAYEHLTGDKPEGDITERPWTATSVIREAGKADHAIVIRCASIHDPETLEGLTDEPADLVVAAEYLMHVPPDRIEAEVKLLKSLGKAVITVDWDEPLPIGKAIAAHNFLHDYRTLFGVGVRRIRTGRQAIYVWRKRVAAQPQVASAATRKPTSHRRAAKA
jgi:hypothetical protein